MFLSKAELDYLAARREFSDDYSYTLKSRLQKKVQRFAREELPLLIEQGYLTEFCKVAQPNLTENRMASSALVAQPGRARLSFENANDNEKISPSRDLNPGPKVFATFPEKERGITKPSLCQAELLGQNKGNFSSTLFNASR